MVNLYTARSIYCADRGKVFPDTRLLIKRSSILIDFGYTTYSHTTNIFSVVEFSFFSSSSTYRLCVEKFSFITLDAKSYMHGYCDGTCMVCL